MKAHIISIGDEILIGQIVNSNAAYIGEKLTSLQIKVNGISVVSDDKAAILAEFGRAYDQNDVIVVTGGLGPTHDDITRECVVEFFNTELVMNNDVYADVKKFFETRGRELTQLNAEQALVPKIAVPIRNDRGTAPGIFIDKNKKIFIVMPGVPHEMKGMMDGFVLPHLEEKLGDKTKFIHTVNLLTTGIPESTLYQKLGDLDGLLNGNKLAFLPNQFGVRLRLTVTGNSDEEAHNICTEIEQKIRSVAGRYIYGKDDDTLESVVAKILNDRGLRIAVAESCTGGLVSNRLTNISGSSNYFERGIISYSNAAKVELLKVDEDIIHKFGAVSLEVARQMAEGVKSVSGADLGIGITGILGPTGATPGKPVGLVYIGICDDKICSAREYRFGDDRLLNKDRTSQAALDMIRRHLLGIQYDD